MAAPAYNCVFTVSDTGGTWDAASCSEVRALNSASATKAYNMTNPNADITLTAVSAGDGGNDITCVFVDPAAASQSIAVSVSGKAISVSLATDGAKAITSTANAVKTALDASAAAALVSTAVEGTGLGIVNALTVAALTGGAGGCQFYNATTAECTCAEAIFAIAQKSNPTTPTG